MTHLPDNREQGIVLDGDLVDRGNADKLNDVVVGGNACNPVRDEQIVIALIVHLEERKFTRSVSAGR